MPFLNDYMVFGLGYQPVQAPGLPIHPIPMFELSMPDRSYPE
jgi:hypothetical protein